MAKSLLPGFSIAYSTRSQSSNVLWVCCWRELISGRRRTKGGRSFFTCYRANLMGDPFALSERLRLRLCAVIAPCVLSRKQKWNLPDGYSPRPHEPALPTVLCRRCYPFLQDS